MHIVKDICEKISDDKLIPSFGAMHSKALLCFYHYKELDVPKLHLIMGERHGQIRKIVTDLTRLGLIKKFQEKYAIDEFETLEKLVSLAETGKEKMRKFKNLQNKCLKKRPTINC